MKSQYQIDKALNIVFTTYSGNITVDDVINKTNAVIADPDFKPGMNSVCDYTEATAVWTLAEVDRFRAYVQKLKEGSARSKWALIFPKGKDTSTARIFVALQNAFSPNLEVQIFRDRHSAMAWLAEVNDSAAPSSVSSKNS
jgi:hypothetical protein